MISPSDQTGHASHTSTPATAPPAFVPTNISPPDAAQQGAQAAMLRASEAARRLAQQTHTQWVVSEHSQVAALFGVERPS